jgi:hypothetical protein
MPITISEFQALATKGDLSEVSSDVKLSQKKIDKLERSLEELIELLKKSKGGDTFVDPEFYRPRQFAKIIQTPYSTVMGWVYEGKIPGAFQREGFGKGWLIPKSALSDLQKLSEKAK